MKRTHVVGRAGKRAERSSRQLTDRRGFLTGAGKYGALLMGAAYVPVAQPAAAARQGPQDADEMPVEQKGVVRVFGATQRRPGQTKMEARFADTPHIVPSYYTAVYQQLTQKAPGRNRGSVLNVVTDAAFGGDGGLPPVSTNLHIQQTPDDLPCTMFVNRDLVCEVSFDPVPAQGRGGFAQGGQGRPNPTARGSNVRGTGWAANLPRWTEPGTEMNLVAQQVLAQGTRPTPIAGGSKAMYFIKMRPAVGAANQLKVWQTLHAKALEAIPAFGPGLQGFEVLQRLPDVAPKQANKCSGEIALPDLVACFWPKDGLKNFTDYARAFRAADTQKALDFPASFFLLVEEFDAAFGG